MSQPTPYTRKFSFTNDQTANPSTKTPGNQLDIEYNAILLTLNQTLSNLALIQRDDGQLANGSVGADQLAPGLATGVSPATIWASPINYASNATVFFGYKLYRALVSHISGVFATDLAAGKWVLIGDFSFAVGTGLTQTTGGGGSVTLNLANDVAAIEALSATGIAARTGSEAWAVRTVTGTASEITVANGDGVAGNPTIALAANGVSNAKLAQMAAYTIKGNATGSLGTPSDIDITTLPVKGSPVSGDIVLILDSAASNAFKQTTVSALASAGSVASIGNATGAITVRGGNLPAQELTVPRYDAAQTLTAAELKQVRANIGAIGNLVAITDYSASATWFPQPGTITVVAKVWGSGGSGGGAPATAGGQISIGSGGGPGGYSRRRITLPVPAAVTISNASPAVVSYTAHGMAAGRPIKFSTTGALPTGVTAGTTYFVIAAGLTANSFQFSATSGGSAVNTSSAGSGVHTLTMGEVITVGAAVAGVSGASGNAGNTSSFGLWCSATGGAAGLSGAAGTASNPGAGASGTGSGGDVNSAGTAGAVAFGTTGASGGITGGQGGAAAGGGGGGGAMGGSSGTGGTGGFPGGGGGGLYSNGGSGVGTGGTSGGGLVTVEEYA
jgi:hypothetical protein